MGVDVIRAWKDALQRFRSNLDGREEMNE